MHQGLEKRADDTVGHIALKSAGAAMEYPKPTPSGFLHGVSEQGRLSDPGFAVDHQQGPVPDGGAVQRGAQLDEFPLPIVEDRHAQHSTGERKE
jgi:hypothetical protein